MEIAEQEIVDLQRFIADLNSAGGVVAVEGMRDAAALRKMGYSGDIMEFHRFGGMVSFAEHAARYGMVILLFDGDRTGRRLARDAIRLLQRRTRVDTTYRRRLRKVTRGKVMFTEQLSCYLGPDAFLVERL